ncbi:MAG: LptF/LptG family permease [Parachlamydiaceae bacterium]
MPILWRYLLSDYIKIVVLTASAFIAILLTSRLEEIAHFASLGPAFSLILLFILYQIPYILPIAIPISCLIAAMLLIQKLSLSHELTALRSSSFSLSAILSPVLLTATFISIMNFYIISEISTNAHLESNLLKTELRSINPLLLLRNKHLMRGKGVFFETLGASKMGEKAQDIVIAMPNNENQTINLVIAKNLKTEQEGFTAEGMTIISSPGKSNGKVRLLLENIGVTQSSVQDFAHFVQKKVTNINNDHLDMSMLIIRLRDYQRNLRETTNREDQKEIKRHINQVYAEMLRRISTALSPLTFTLMGLSFGMNIGRKANAKRVFFAILLAAFYLIAFFAAKGLGNQLFLAAFFYLIPHLLIALLSMRYLRRISQGVT